MKNKTMAIRSLSGGVLLLLFVLVGCASGPAPASSDAADPGAEKQSYVTAGRAIRMLEAMNQTSIEAIKLAVADIIGPEYAEAYHAKLAQVLYNTDNPNAYIFKDETETVRKDKAGEEYIYERRVVVNMTAIRRTLEANDLIPGESSAAAAVVAKEKDDSSSASRAAETSSSDSGGGPTAEEKEIIRRYVDRMTYLVYFDEETTEDEFYAKMAVGIANEYLTSNTMETIDLEQVQKLKTDQARAYEEETGQEVSLIQWIAQKLNADVYVEIDAKTTGETSSSKRHYGQANVTIKAFEASTGRLLGTQNWNSPRTVSSTSQDDAKLNAVQASVFKSMPVVIDQTKSYMLKATENGIRYELIVQNTEDARMMNTFRRKLEAKVKDVKTVSQSAEETKYNVWLIGDIEDLVDAVYDVSEIVDGLEDIEQVMMRSKSVTFNTGL